MSAEDDSNVIHIEFPRNDDAEPEDGLNDVQRIECAWLEIDALIRAFRERTGNTLGLRRLDAIERDHTST